MSQFGELASNDFDIDRELDKRVLKLARSCSTNLLLDGRLAGLLLGSNDISAFKVWIDAEMSIRVQRISGREGQSLEQALLEIQERQECERERFLAIYELDLANTSIYDLVVDTSNIDQWEAATQVLEALKAQEGDN